MCGCDMCVCVVPQTLILFFLVLLLHNNATEKLVTRTI